MVADRDGVRQARAADGGISRRSFRDFGLVGLSPFPYFAAYDNVFSVTGIELAERAFVPQYPQTFTRDVAAGRLPAVSWIIPPLAECEHPAAPPAWGEYLVSHVLATLVSNPEVWAKTVLFVTFDENGGFFDHIPPPTAPPGTPGEYLAVAKLPGAAEGIRGPIGLGFRVPCLVISPFSRGGYVCHDTFDHTSLLRFLEARFGVEVPNLTTWRRGVTGDLTATLRLSQPVSSVPTLPPTSVGSNTANVAQRVLDALAGTLDLEAPYPIPHHNSMPSQEKTPPRAVV